MRAVLAAALAALLLPACQAPAVTPPAAEAATGAVSIRVALPARRLQAVAADVERVSIRIDSYNVSTYGYEKSLDRAAIAANQAVTFTGLVTKHGQDLYVKAYDAAGRQIGQVRDSILITGNGVDQKTVKLTLAPTYTEAPTAGAVTVGIQVPDLPAVGTILGTIPSPVESGDFWAVDSTGAIWLSNYSDLYKIAPDGAVLVSKPQFSPWSVWDLQVDPDDNVWVNTARGMVKLDPDGAQLAETGNLGDVYRFALDATGHPWIGTHDGVEMIGADGSRLARHFDRTAAHDPGRARFVAVDEARDQVWYTRGPQGGLGRFSLAGADLGLTPGYGAEDFKVHPGDGHAWVYSSPNNSGQLDLVRIAPDGTFATRTPATLHGGYWTFDQAGNCWGTRPTKVNHLYKLSPTGSPLGVTTIPGEGVDGILTAPDGTLLVHGRNKIYRIQP